MPDQSKQSRFMIAAPYSGSGKTVLTLGLLRAFRDRGLNVASAKAGPDYIDPAFHEAATGAPSVNLDPWAMSHEETLMLADRFMGRSDVSVIEAMMGLFDGAADGTGSAADLASQLRMPVVLVVDCARMAHSIAALVCGYRDHRKDITLTGVILNKVGSERHEKMLRAALENVDVPVLGAIHRHDDLALPSRHLGLVQAGETSGLEQFIARAAKRICTQCDLDQLLQLQVSKLQIASPDFAFGVQPLGQRMAIARDEAFSFLYPHLVEGWRSAGAELSFFSPLADEPPGADADAVFLPGGYPELHACRLAAATHFQRGLREAADRGAQIHGECGGYMVLGDRLIDADGHAHAMSGLLRLETSFETRKLHLGYRALTAIEPFAQERTFSAHEFHYTTATREEGEPLFKVTDALGNDLGNAGLRDGSVSGSYMHIIAAGRPDEAVR